MPYNELSSYFSAAVGAFYAVLLAFVVVAVWEDMNAAKDNTYVEANALPGLYFSSTQFDPKQRAEFPDVTVSYAKAVIEDEWPRLADGQPSQQVEDVAKRTAAAQQSTLDLFAKRSVLSLPAVPTVGGGFVGGGELLDAQGAKVGDGHSYCGIVHITTDLPPAVLAQCNTVYRMKDGELHLSSLRTYRPLAMAFDDCPVAVLGGTGAYANKTGDGKITKLADPDRAYKVTLNIT